MTASSSNVGVHIELTGRRGAKLSTALAMRIQGVVVDGMLMRQRVGGGSGTSLQTSNAPGLMPPPTVLYGPKHSALSSYKRCQVTQSVRSFGTWAGRLAEGADATEAGAALEAEALRLVEASKALARSA